MPVLTALGLWRRLAVLIGVYWLVASQAVWAQSDTAAPPDDPTTTQPAYVTQVVGLEEEPDLLATLEQASRLIRLVDEPPAGRAGLVRRAEADLETFATVLRSEGFYQSDVSFEIDTATDPPVVSVAVDPGPVYLLAAYDIVFEPPAPTLPAGIDALGLEIGMWARSRPIVEAQDLLLADLAEAGYPLANVIERRAVVDHAETTLSVELRLDPGPFSTFGDTAITGLKRIDERFVRRRIPWPRGAPYDQRQVDELRANLLASGLFASVSVRPATALASDGTLPINIDVREGKQRSVGLGGDFSTSEGFAAIAFWEHRSLLGEGETLRISATVGEIEQKVEARYRIPGFIRLDQDFVSSVEVGREDTDAFESVGLRSSAGLERRFGKRWRGFAGLSFDLQEIDDQEDGESNITLFGVPVSATRDTADDLIDATEGTRLTLSVTPFVGNNGGSIAFLSSEVGAASFLPLLEDRRLVLATRARLGSIVGEPTATVPPDRRFYAGGGGSIRGFELQSVGPLDAENDPLGGRSVYEIGIELRARLTDTIGIVPFLEGGQVFDDSVPDLSEEPLWAAGLGLRYFTVVGPIRFDIAAPLNGRDSDDSFQFYISIGQAF